MSAPFSGSIIGSWLFTRSSEPSFKPRIIYHFTADGRHYLEMDHDGKRALVSVKYKCAGSKLTLIYASGAKNDFELTAENDGSVMVPSANGVSWWMVRLASPEPYSKAFVDEHGHMHKLSGS